MHNLPRRPVPAAPAAPPGSLAATLAPLPDPRRPFGWHPGRAPLPLAGVLQVGLAAILCGGKSLYAIAQWATERVADDPACLVDLGLPAGRHPSVATLHRVFKALTVAALERIVADWLAGAAAPTATSLARDGKTLRGRHADGGSARQWVAAFAQPAQAVLGQRAAAGPGHELAAVKRLVTQVPLAGRRGTGDAVQTQRAVCPLILAGGGDDRLPVEENPPSLAAELAARGGGLTAVAEVAPKARHGRHELRLLWALTDPDLNAYLGRSGSVGEPWPGIAQVCRGERRRVVRHRGTPTEERAVRSAMTSRPAATADATALLAALRDHWGIAHKLHWVRDETLGEDRCRVRTGTAPEVFAIGRNLALTRLRRRGIAAIAATLRTDASRWWIAISLVRLAGAGLS